MPQPKRQSKSKGSTGARTSGAGRSTTQKRANTVRQTAQQRKAAASRRAGTAKKGSSKASSKASASKSSARAASSKASSKRSSARRSSARAASSSNDDMRRNVQGAIEVMAHGVVITRDRIQEVMDDAVERGRMTRGDANTIVSDILKLSRKQTDELRKQVEALRADVEQLVGRAGGKIEKSASDARRRAMRGSAGDRALREVDRARRVAGLGRFPILNYEDLTAGQITERLADLSPAELRKVRDHERRNANRKSVLTAIERALG